MPAPEKKPMMVKTYGKLPGWISWLKLAKPMARRNGPKGLMSGVNMKMSSSTSTGPVTAPGMK